MLSQTARVRFVNYCFFLRNLRLASKRCRIFYYIGFWRIFTRIEITPRRSVELLSASSVHTAVFVGESRRIRLIVRHFAGIRVKKNFIRVKTVSVAVNVAYKSFIASAAFPVGRERPVRAPAAECVYRTFGSVFEFCTPNVVAALGKPIVVLCLFAVRLFVYFKENFFRIFGIERKRRLSARNMRA